jgi:hypothetical protein
MNPLEEESNGRIKTFHSTVHQSFISIKIPNPYKKCMNFQQTKNLVLIATKSQPKSLSLPPVPASHQILRITVTISSPISTKLMYAQCIQRTGQTTLPHSNTILISF